MEKRRLCASGSGVWGLGGAVRSGYSVQGAGDGETQVEEGERALLAPLLGCSESGKEMNWREKEQPAPFPSGMCTWEDVLLCCHGSSLGHCSGTRGSAEDGGCKAWTPSCMGKEWCAWKSCCWDALGMLL